MRHMAPITLNILYMESNFRIVKPYDYKNKITFQSSVYLIIIYFVFSLKVYCEKTLQKLSFSVANLEYSWG